jgi:hypothetical protein
MTQARSRGCNKSLKINTSGVGTRLAKSLIRTFRQANARIRMMACIGSAISVKGEGAATGDRSPTTESADPKAVQNINACS